jgi:sulfate/thiosulfate transport system ATP-binding protein
VSIAVRNVVKRFGNFVALDDVSLDVPAGSLLALLGPSGSGKTTLLRVIAGLEGADTGSVLYHDEDVTKRSPRDRNVGFVFQHYALFRHMTVFENVAFGLRVRRAPKSQVDARVRELLHLVRLDGFGGRYPPQLSGGQRQRVALARALAVEPGVLLLDEPFGALDAKVRQELRQWLRRFHDEIKVTTIFVTHDQEEAFEVADRVVVMNNGRVEQHGTPQEVFDHPANPFVMDFLGNVNVFQGRLQNGKMLLGGIEMAYPAYPHGESRAATAYIRPHELDIGRSPADASSLRAKVLQITPNGSVAKVRLESEHSELELNVEINLDRYAELGLQPGDLVHVAPRHVRVFFPEDYAI